MNIREYVSSDDVESLNERMRSALGGCREREYGRPADLIRTVFGEGNLFGESVEGILAGDRSCAQGGIPINTYPFGEPTDRIYPDMLAIYKGETKTAGWHELLKNAYSYAVSKANGAPEDRNILILTDSWSPKMLEKLEEKLLDVYFMGHLTVTVFLYTYCGYTAIPLITGRQWFGEAPRKPAPESMLFTFETIPSAHSRSDRYIIEIRDGYGRIIRERDREVLYAGRRAVKQFMGEIMSLPLEPVNERRTYMPDAPGYDFDLSEAIPRDVTDSYGDETRGKITGAFLELIRSSRKKKH